MTKPLRASRVRMAFTVSVLSATLLLVAGCTGDGEAGAFEREFAGNPAIESMELTSHDNQPFTGGVSGDVFVRDEVTDEDFETLVTHVSDYTQDNADRMRGEVSLLLGGYELLVTGTALDVDAARLLLALRADARTTAAAIGASTVAVRGNTAEDSIELARDVPALIEDTALNGQRNVSTRSDDGTVSIGASADASNAAVRVWDALRAEVPLTGIRARDDERIVVTLQHEADLARAQDAAAGLVLEHELAFASNLIQLGDSDGADARVFLSRLDDAERARIAYVWVSDNRMQVGVRTEADLISMVQVVDVALPERITDASLVLDGDVENSVPARPAA